MVQKRLWGGRFATAPDEIAAQFTASILFDNRMVREDIRGSVAHVRMLGRQGIIEPDEAAEIERGLWLVWNEVESGTFDFSVQDEDIHTAVENRLRALIGPLQGKLHTGRSRNDQVVTDTRLWTKGALLELSAGVVNVIDALAEVAAQHVETVMPGYTHTQRAQPVVLGHHLHAYITMFQRDLQRLRQAYQRADVSALGSAAMAGATYPLDREFVAADLGMGGISVNSMDAIADRDFVLDALYAMSLVQLHLSRLSEELIYWSSGEFRFVTISDAFSTGSSIMPQKKNADVAELTRGRSGRVFGNLAGTLTMLKGLPLTYNSDMQEDKEALFEAFDTVSKALAVYPGMIRTLTVNKERMAEAAIADFILATDAADLLAKNGVPFREAHEVIGGLVGKCTAENRTFADLTDAEWAEVHPVFGQQKPPLTAEESVALRDLPGGTAPRQVAMALELAAAATEDARAWVAGERDAREAVLSKP
ncbi:MAG: argininosuccinate lyase [Thermomicrobiales bacterium]